MKIHVLVCLLLVSNIFSRIASNKISENDSFKKELQRLALKSFLSEEFKSDDDRNSEDEALKSELKRILMKRNKLNELKKLSVLNG